MKTVKEPGLKGALRSFIHPEKQTFEAVKDLTFVCQFTEANTAKFKLAVN